MVACILLAGCRAPADPEPPSSPKPDAPVADEAPPEPSPTTPTFTLAKLRASFDTTVELPVAPEPAPDPPPDIFDKIHYAGPLGDYVAYVSPVQAGKRRPAIVWIAGGMEWSIGPSLWEPAPRDNDQTAAAFRHAGVVLMHPALRGASGNPGHPECFGGEIDDVIAAADYLATRPDVDPARIYLGGHSTGGTMALLVAESTARFRAVFAFGPVTHPVLYGEDCLASDLPTEELELRSAAFYLSEIVTPTFIIEGSGGNAQSLSTFESLKKDAPVSVVEIPNADHFNVLAPATELIADRILRDTGETVDLQLDGPALTDAVAR